jgi:uncharacterized protein (DUF924 family)
MQNHEAADIVEFWRTAGPERWFVKDAEFDRAFHDRLVDLHFAAARREFDHWAQTAKGSLALLILLDQFPRNCFRGSGHMFATDPLARYFARNAIAAGHDRQVDEELRVFIYLPFEHSEDLADQLLSVELTRSLPEDYMKYALEHLDIIQRFGRFPHRNPMLGRETTPGEQAFLDSGGFAG